jgi:hypothetical protein
LAHQAWCTRRVVERGASMRILDLYMDLDAGLNMQPCYEKRAKKPMVVARLQLSERSDSTSFIS